MLRGSFWFKGDSEIARKVFERGTGHVTDSYLVCLGTCYGTKVTYGSAIYVFNRILTLLALSSSFGEERMYPPRQVDIFLALATMVYHMAAFTCRVAKFAAEDAWLPNGHRGPVIEQTLWMRMYHGFRVYKGRWYKEMTAISGQKEI